MRFGSLRSQHFAPQHALSHNVVATCGAFPASDVGLLQVDVRGQRFQVHGKCWNLLIIHQAKMEPTQSKQGYCIHVYKCGMQSTTPLWPPAMAVSHIDICRPCYVAKTSSTTCWECTTETAPLGLLVLMSMHVRLLWLLWM